jgi:hypothetical protein
VPTVHSSMLCVRGVYAVRSSWRLALVGPVGGQPGGMQAKHAAAHPVWLGAVQLVVCGPRCVPGMVHDNIKPMVVPPVRPRGQAGGQKVLLCMVHLVR